MTPLMIAIFQECLESVKVLVANKADVNARVKKKRINSENWVCSFQDHFLSWRKPKGKNPLFFFDMLLFLFFFLFIRMEEPPYYLRPKKKMLKLLDISSKMGQMLMLLKMLFLFLSINEKNIIFSVYFEQYF